MQPRHDARRQPSAFPHRLREFVDESVWTFAKTMPDWPHEYIVRERVDETLFEDLVRHIRAHGHEGNFYKRVLIYYEEGGMVYWIMGAPVHETTIVNRCKAEDTYERRLEAGTLPLSAVHRATSTWPADRHSPQPRTGRLRSSHDRASADRPP